MQQLARQPPSWRREHWISWSAYSILESSPLPTITGSSLDSFRFGVQKTRLTVATGRPWRARPGAVSREAAPRG